jgi:hypothetical protein
MPEAMPLYKFPEEASYSGSGDVNLAASWSTEVPLPVPLQTT